MSAPRGANITRACTCKRATHQHGEYGAYAVDKCRCDPCRDANRRYGIELRRRQAYGRDTLVDVTPAREAIKRLRDAGMNLPTIAEHAGVAHGTLVNITTGRHGKPTQRAKRETVAAILAVKPCPTGTCGVDATGTIRRLQALIALGHSGRSLGRRLGRAGGSIDALLTPPTGRVLASTARAVAALYDDLWDVTPPPSSVTTRTRNLARAHGYAVPMAWDDDTIDDPTARPSGIEGAA